MKATMDDLKHILDGASVLTALGSLVGILPAVAAALSIVWTVLRIYESKTVQGWIKRREK